MISFDILLRSLTSLPFRTFSVWKKIPKAPMDPIFGSFEAFKKDLHTNKVDLSLASFRDNEGRPVVLESVKKAQTMLFETPNLDHEYLPVEGSDVFIKSALKIAYGEGYLPLKENRIGAIQSLSGTGALRLGLEFCKKFIENKGKPLYIPKPSWPNHKNMCIEMNLPYKEYRYYDTKLKAINFNGLIADLDDAEPGSIILLHACAHNPTGVDLSVEQWKQLKDLMLKRKHMAFFDMAFQGFASGDIVKDAFGLQLFSDEKNKIPVILAHSFSKIFGLYGQRIGCLSTICTSEQEAFAVQSQMKILARRLYSNPPLYGARIVSLILNNPELFQLWMREIKIMYDRIIAMRKLFVKSLGEAGSKLNWEHLNQQTGMFGFTGIEEEQVKFLAEKFQIYLSNDGRMSISGINTKNVKYVAESFHEVTKEYEHL